MFHLINNNNNNELELEAGGGKVVVANENNKLAHKMDYEFKEMSASLAKISHQLNEFSSQKLHHDDDDNDSDSSSAISSPASPLSTSSSSSCILAQQQQQSITEITTTNNNNQLQPKQLNATLYPTQLNHDDNDENHYHHYNNNNLNDLQAAGAPKRSRSLVDDARLDTQRNKQLIEEIRREQQQLRASIDLRDDDDSAAVGVVTPGKVGVSDELIPEGEKKLSQEKETDDEHDEAKEAEKFLIDFPRHISDLDHCNHLLIKYEPELDPTHPGFHDLEYRARRKEVAEVAFNYKHGEKIPEIAYDEKERATWKAIYLRLKEAYKKYACEQHNAAIRQLEHEQVYSPDFIPQLQQVSEFLERRTGWRLRPVAGLLSARDFLASLAFRVFQTTQYIRHWGNPEHSVEPDCIHELMGHIPMLCDPEFAQFSQELGLASLGASDEQIEKFATLYWFTVEFGLCREGGATGTNDSSQQLKCYGAGLLSSYGEMEHALESGKPALKEFVPEETAIETYDDSEYQVVYYVARSFQEAKYKIKQYAQAHLSRQYELAYDPYTCSIKELSSYEQLESYASTIKSDMNRLCEAINKLKLADHQKQQSQTNKEETNNSQELTGKRVVEQ